jgi:hypothetical protein
MSVFPRMMYLFESARQLLEKASTRIRQVKLPMGAFEKAYSHPLFKGFNLLTNRTW